LDLEVEGKWVAWGNGLGMLGVFGMGLKKKKKKRVGLGNLGYIREFGKSGEG